MNSCKQFLTLVICTLITFSISAQDKNDTIVYNFKKGEVLDVLLLTNGPEVEKLFPRYRKTAFPIALKFSFKPVPGFPIIETLQGGVQPKSMIFGRWESIKKREGFLEAIVPAVPDFHEQRRAIWDYFTLTYYEMQQDINITIDRSKFNVVTSYWGSGTDFKNYLHQIETAIKQYDGKNVLTLTNGASPVGYVYNPNKLVITQWENKAAFDKFYKEYQAMDETRIENVHQFVIQ